jgi:hypothetical protein
MSNFELWHTCRKWTICVWRLYVCMYVYIGFKTLFYAVRHLDSTASYLPTDLHLGFFRLWEAAHSPQWDISTFSEAFVSSSLPGFSFIAYDCPKILHSFSQEAVYVTGTFLKMKSGLTTPGVLVVETVECGELKIYMHLLKNLQHSSEIGDLEQGRY